MKEAKLIVNVWQRDTKWGDSIYFYCGATHWKRTCKLSTSTEAYPWWHGELSINTDGTATGLECKMAIWRDGCEIWENIKGNRTITIQAGTQNLYLKFGEKCWGTCPLCETAIDEIPIMCETQHPIHRECFELYLDDQLQKKSTSFSCMKCAQDIADDWKTKVCPSLVKRYERVRAEENGATVLTCPMANCDFEVVYPPDDHSLPDNEQCYKCGVVWCTKCKRLGTLVDGECVVCTKGLKDVADQVFDALDDVNGAKCPKCNQRGQKLASECTHISCDCGEVFCYCCGLPGSAVDTSDEYASTDLDRLYGHNDDYYSNTSRCPMWLVNYADLYTEWPDDVEDAQERFHQFRSSSRLRALKESVCQAQWDQFMQTNENVKSTVDHYLAMTFTPS